MSHICRQKCVLSVASQFPGLFIILFGCFIVLILDGNSDIGAHVRPHLCYLICLRRWIRSSHFIFPKKTLFVYTCFMLYLYQMVSQRNGWARKEQSLLFDLFKAFDRSSHIFFLQKYFLAIYSCATCSELSSTIITMSKTGCFMVLILDCNSENVAHL